MIDLAFMRRDSPYQMTDIVFHLSYRQAADLKKAPANAAYDYIYDGHLTPDNEPEPMITIAKIQHSPLENVMSVITTEFLGGNQNATVTRERAEKLQPYVGKPMSQEEFRELLSVPVELMD